MGIFPVEFRHKNLILRGVVFDNLCQNDAGDIAEIIHFRQKYHIFAKYENIGRIAGNLRNIFSFYLQFLQKFSFRAKSAKSAFFTLLRELQVK